MIASSSNCIKRAKKSLIHTLITEHSKLDALHVSMNGVYYLVSYSQLLNEFIIVGHCIKYAQCIGQSMYVVSTALSQIHNGSKHI